MSATPLNPGPKEYFLSAIERLTERLPESRVEWSFDELADEDEDVIGDAAFAGYLTITPNTPGQERRVISDDHTAFAWYAETGWSMLFPEHAALAGGSEPDPRKVAAVLADLHASNRGPKRKQEGQSGPVDTIAE